MLQRSCEVHNRVPSFNQKAILNATTKPAPAETDILLSLGPKFALPYTSTRQIPFFHLLADVENILTEQKNRNIRDDTRCQIINATQNYVHRQSSNMNSTPLDRFCKMATSKTKQFVRNNPDILIAEADKGNRTVIMYLDDYNNKMLQLLNDTKIYKPTKSDPTGSIQDGNNLIVQRLDQLKLIDADTQAYLTCKNGTCPRIYGQPKAHKAGLPLRPVVPNITSPTYNMSKYIARILQQSFTSQFNVKDSKSFCEYVNNLQVPAGHILVSFDVVSLFTNVPQHLVRRDISMMWDQIQPNTLMNLCLFLEIVSFCIDSSYFCFQKRFYKQIFGTAMGSPLSPIAADIVTEKLLITVTTQANIPIQHIRKYVDDLFLILPKDEVDNVLKVFNSYDPNLQFTYEVEQGGKLPFLDLLIIRNDDNTLRTDWYAKPISSGRLLNFHSMHPLQQKIGVVSNFISRVRTLSTVRNRDEQNAVISEHLLRNDYPKHLVNRMLHQPLHNRSPPPRPPPGSYRSIPSVPGLTHNLKRILQHNIPTITVAVSNKNVIKQLYPTTKEPLPDALKKNVVYVVCCRNCPGRYVGLTTTRLRERMYGHQTHINSLDRYLKAGHQYSDPLVQQLKEKSALVQHCIDHQHRFDIKNPTILDRTYRTHTLPFLEMCHIATTSNTVNKRTDTDGLSVAYAHLLSSIACTRNPRSITNTTQPSRSATDQPNPSHLLSQPPTALPPAPANLPANPIVF